MSKTLQRVSLLRLFVYKSTKGYINSSLLIIPQPHLSTASMKKERPSAKQLSEQLLRFEHLKALPDLVEQIQSTVDSVQAQMKFEEREYLLLQERQIVINEKIVHTIREQAKRKQNEKKIIYLVGPLFSLGEISQGDGKIRRYKEDLSLINNLYDKFSEKLDRVQKRINRVIETEVHAYQDIPREEGSIFAEIKPTFISMNAVKRFEKAIECINFIQKCQERRQKIISLDQ